MKMKTPFKIGDVVEFTKFYVDGDKTYTGIVEEFIKGDEDNADVWLVRVDESLISMTENMSPKVK